MAIQIYVGNIKKMYIDGLKYDGSSIKRVPGYTIVKENCEFYRNRFNKIINFYYDTYLPDRAEASDYFENFGLNNVLFVDYHELKYVNSIEKDEFKEKKKTYIKK